jgi:hypothetical protein
LSAAAIFVSSSTLYHALYLYPCTLSLVGYGSAQQLEKGCLTSVSLKVQEVGYGCCYFHRKESHFQKSKNAVETKPLSYLGFSSTMRVRQVKLDNSIYVRICPSEVKKHMFVYKVVSLNEGCRTAKVKYLEQVVKEGGNRYCAYKEDIKVQVHYM